MADVLKTFEEGESILASETNSNNNYLLNMINTGNTALKNEITTNTNTLKSNISSVQQTLQANIDKLSTTVSQKVDKSTRNFVQKQITIGIGTTSLSSYLPNDGNKYLVWINAYHDGGYVQLTAKTDVMTTERVLYHTDNDSGRNSIAAAFCVLPVGTGRSITTAGSANWIYLCGYCPI